MKRMTIAAAVAVTMLAPVQAMADPWDRDGHWKDRRAAEREYRKDVREARREYEKDRREAEREYHKDLREARRDWRRYGAYDWNRWEPGYRGYHAERYYRDGRYYRPYRVTRAHRIYRGGDGRYYCRRDDGTTGLIVGAAVGGLLGNELARGESATLATIIGAGAGALLGREIDRGDIVCR